MAPGDGPAEGEAAIEVEVAYSPAAGQVVQVTLSLPAGATVAQALRASGLLSRHPELQAESLQCGVWGILCAGDVRLHRTGQTRCRAVRRSTWPGRHRRS